MESEMREVSAGISAGVALRRVKLDLLDIDDCGCWRDCCAISLGL